MPFIPFHRQVKLLLCTVTTLSTERITNRAFVSLSLYKRKYLCLFDLTLSERSIFLSFVQYFSISLPSRPCLYPPPTTPTPTPCYKFCKYLMYRKMFKSIFYVKRMCMFFIYLKLKIIGSFVYMDGQFASFNLTFHYVKNV